MKKFFLLPLGLILALAACSRQPSPPPGAIGALDSALFSNLKMLCVRQGVTAPADTSRPFKPGDTLLFSYYTGRYRNLTVFSLDPQGALTFYPKLDPFTASVEIKRRAAGTFPARIPVDSLASRTLFFGIFSERPLGTYKIKPWIETQRRAAGGDLKKVWKGLQYQSLFATQTYVLTFLVQKSNP